MSGRLVVIEGADGAGGEEQSKRLLSLLRERGIPAKRHRYPDYSGPVGRLIHDFLHKKHDFSPEILLLLYGADMVKDICSIRAWLRQGNTVILDRYFTSTLAYQGMQGIKLENCLRFADIFGLPKPDFIIYLRVSPEVSMERKAREKESLDRNESDKGFISGVLDSYDYLIKNNIFGQWYVVDADRSIEEVFAEIRKILRV
jgi:dTMP kinase